MAYLYFLMSFILIVFTVDYMEQFPEYIRGIVGLSLGALSIILGLITEIIIDWRLDR